MYTVIPQRCWNQAHLLRYRLLWHMRFSVRSWMQSHTCMAVGGCRRKHNAWASGQKNMENNTWSIAEMFKSPRKSSNQYFNEEWSGPCLDRKVNSFQREGSHLPASPGGLQGETRLESCHDLPSWVLLWVKAEVKGIRTEITPARWAWGRAAMNC